MILAVSTFKVANGLDDAVCQAFLDRPRLVEGAAGFLGMEVLVDSRDSSIFQLLTRWTDEASFRSWHTGPLHNLSHSGIPKGIRLDATHTTLRVFDVLPEGTLFAGVQEQYRLTVATDGRIIAANPAFASLLERDAGTIEGQALAVHLTAADDAKLAAMLKSSISQDHILLNFVDRRHDIHTLTCRLDKQGGNFVLSGEPVRQHEQALLKELLELNNQWAVLVRENEKNAKSLMVAKGDLEKTLKDLNESHWHLRKIQELLPMCMYCGRVRTGEARWEGVVDYLMANSLFLTHGCCPNCVHLMDGS